MKTARTLSELRDFLLQTIDQSGFSISSITFSEQADWNRAGGYIAHRTHGFFYVTGLRQARSGQERLVLYQPQSAITGLAFCRMDGTLYTLLQARIEPGNTGIGQYGPTIQSTPANFLKLHGGKQTSCLEYFYQLCPGANPLGSSMQLDLGERYFQKSKTHQYVELEEPIEPEGPMIWASLEALRAALPLSNFLNADLRSLISVFDWDRFLHGESISGLGDHGASLVRDLAALEVSADPWRMCPIHLLDRWRLTEEGVEDRIGQRLSVGLHRTVCGSREVASWVQPLMAAKSMGLVLLLLRESRGGAEFLVSILPEVGISGSAAIGPSQLSYPGEPIPDLSNALHRSETLVSFIQSDEGGRFFQHESEYRLARVDRDFPAAPNQYWISAADLRFLLGNSNLVNFQLRCIASCLHDLLNPVLARDAGAVRAS